jgi:hypothetical protein
MDKRYLSPLELLNIAKQHAYAADYVLQQASNATINQADTITALIPVASLMYQAFQLSLKAYCLHDHRPVKEYKNLLELLELNKQLDFSLQELLLLKTLTKQQSYLKGFDYDLWEDQEQLKAFFDKIFTLYQKLQTMMPLELHPDYQQ